MEIEPVITIAPSWMRKDSGIRDDHYVVLEKKKIFIGNKQIIDHGNKSNALQIMLAKYMCVGIFTYIYHETFICLEQLECQGTGQKCYNEDIIIFSKPLIATLE